MNRGPLRFLFACAAFFFACSPKGADENSVRLEEFRVVLHIPAHFKPIPPERFVELEKPETTVPPVEPFTVIPRYGYAEPSGKAFMIVSELRFGAGAVPETYPLDNLYRYQKNLEAWFGAGGITSEETGGGGVSTVLLAMMFTEEGTDITLLKGLCYKAPARFFMIDLYVVNARADPRDAEDFQNVFESLRMY